ncbi:hypothetical protein Tco_1099251 [Tanacetum coccineum]
MSADSAVTYTSVHSEARSWSIPSEDPYEEAAQQLFEQAPRSPEYVPKDHVPVYIPELTSPEDLVPAEDEAPTPPLPSFFFKLHGPHQCLPIPLPAPSTSRRADIPEADTPPRKRLLLTTPRPECEVGESSAAAARQPGPTIETRLRDTERRMMTALEWTNRRVTYRLRLDIEERETCLRAREYGDSSALARSEAHCKALEAESYIIRDRGATHECSVRLLMIWRIQHIRRNPALELEHALTQWRHWLPFLDLWL